MPVSYTHLDVYKRQALSNLFFLKTEGAVATEVIQDIDKIIPYFINKAMPDWFAALFMLCILSASMSTLSSQFHTMGASVGSDIYGTYKPRSRGKDVYKRQPLDLLIKPVL